MNSRRFIAAPTITRNHDKIRAMDRREFLAGAAAVPAVFAAERAIPRREYKPGIELSVIGFGGIVVVGQEQPAANRTVAETFDRGINYFDVAPSYWDGEA